MAKKQRTGGKALGGMWNTARETTSRDGGDLIPVSPGSYLMQLVSCVIQDFKGVNKLWWKWVIVEAEDPADVGKICNDFEGVDDPERLVWVQRHLIGLGVALDEREIETYEDLLDTYQELIEDCCVARVKVTEKDGYTNMRVSKRTEVDEELLVDPKTALSGGGSSQKSQSSDADEGDEGDDEEAAVDVGSRVVWGDDEENVGVIVSFTDDDEFAYVRPDGKKTKVKVPMDLLDLEDLVGGDGDESDEEEIEDDADDADDENGGDAEEVASYEWNVDDECEAVYPGDGEWYEAVVIKAGTKSVGVRFVDDDEEAVVKSDQIRSLDEEGDEEGGEEEALEFEKGDSVVFKVRGKDKVGIVVSVNSSTSKARVKDAAGKVHSVSLDALDFETD